MAATTLATGTTATVEGGRLSAPTIPVRTWHVDPVNDPTRSWERPSPGLLLPTDPGSSTSR